MPDTSASFQRHADAFDRLRATSLDDSAASDLVLAAAEDAKRDLDRHLGIGNWRSAMLVRTVGVAIGDGQTEVSGAVVGRFSAMLRSASQPACAQQAS